MSFEIYPVDPVREDDVVSTGFRWRFVKDGQILGLAYHYSPTRTGARREAEKFRESILIGGKRIAWSPIVDVDKEGKELL